MSRPEKPHSTDEMINQLWYAIIGANSEGIAERVKAIDERLHKVEQHLPNLITYDEHESCHDSERRRKWRTTDVVLAAGMLIVGLLAAIGAFR
jgi:hypothetical protein